MSRLSVRTYERTTAVERLCAMSRLSIRTYEQTTAVERLCAMNRFSVRKFGWMHGQLQWKASVQWIALVNVRTYGRTEEESGGYWSVLYTATHVRISGCSDTGWFKKYISWYIPYTQTLVERNVMVQDTKIYLSALLLYGCVICEVLTLNEHVLRVCLFVRHVAMFCLFRWKEKLSQN